MFKELNLKLLKDAVKAAVVKIGIWLAKKSDERELASLVKRAASNAEKAAETAFPVTEQRTLLAGRFGDTQILPKSPEAESSIDAALDRLAQTRRGLGELRNPADGYAKTVQGGLDELPKTDGWGRQ